MSDSRGGVGVGGDLWTLMQEPPGDIVVSGSFDRFFVNGQIREALELMPLELGDHLAQFRGVQAGTNNGAS